MKNFLIGDIAKLLGVTPESIRHYERMGLIKPSYVAENGYRYYDTRSYTFLFFIKKYRSLGFTLKETEDLLYNDGDEIKVQKLAARKQIIESQIAELEKKIVSLDQFQSDIETASQQVERFDMVKTKPQYLVPIRTKDGLCLSTEQIKNTRAMMDNITEIQYTMLADLKRENGVLLANKVVGFSKETDGKDIPEGAIYIPECTALRAVIIMYDGEKMEDGFERRGVIKKLEELGIDMNRRVFGHMTNVSMYGDSRFSTFRLFIPVEILSDQSFA